MSCPTTVKALSHKQNLSREESPAESLYQLAINACGFGVWDWPQVQNSEVVFWSDSVYTLLGFDPGEVSPTRRELKKLVHPDHQDHLCLLVNEQIQTGTAFDTRALLLTQSGDYRWFRMRSYTTWGSERQPIRLSGTLEDIHRLIKQDLPPAVTTLVGDTDIFASLEEELRESQASRRASENELVIANKTLERCNQELQQFVYTVSHDLKAPLVSISGFLQRLWESDKVTSDPDLKFSLQRIDFNVNGMSKLLQDLLTLSRIIHREIISEEFLFQDLMVSVRLSLESKIKETAAQIETHFSCDRVIGQFSLFVQFFTNLLDNSLKYKQDSCPPQIRISSELVGEDLVIIYQDNGIGIPENLHSRVFGIFERFHPETAPGSGVGLAIVKRIVERHGGVISFQSQVNQGTTFRMRFFQAKSPKNSSS